jgi:hypothetical protein
MRFRKCVVCLLAALLAVSGCGAPSGPPQFQVTGQVLVNGKPYPYVVVQFHNQDPNVTGNASVPVAATEPDGTFRLSTNGEKDGVVTGDYVVTFFWTDNGPGFTDLLGGKYSRKESSEFRVSIQQSDRQLEPFNLEVDDQQLQKAEKKLEMAAANQQAR